MESNIVKAVFGELTLGEVYELIRDRVHLVIVRDAGGVEWGPYGTISLSPGVSLELSNQDLDESHFSDPEFSFPLGGKVSVKEDHLEFVTSDHIGEEEVVRVYFLFRPEPQTIKFDFLLPKD